MPYVLYQNYEAPQFLIGSILEFEENIKDINKGAEIERVHHYGNRKLEENEIPKVLVLEKKRKTIPAGFLTRSSMFIVNKSVQNFLTKLDSGIHQFFPIEVKYKDGSRPEGEFFVMNVTYKQDSIVDENSSVESYFHPKTDKMKIRHFRKNVTVQKSVLSNMNIWREERYPKSLLISDSFFEFLNEQKMKFLKSYKAKN